MGRGKAKKKMIRNALNDYQNALSSIDIDKFDQYDEAFIVIAYQTY